MSLLLNLPLEIIENIIKLSERYDYINYYKLIINYPILLSCKELRHNFKNIKNIYLNLSTSIDMDYIL